MWFEQRSETALDGQAARQVLLELPLSEREVVILRIWGQMTLHEASAVTGRAVSTLHDQYQAAIEKLRQRMMPDEQA